MTDRTGPAQLLGDSYRRFRALGSMARPRPAHGRRPRRKSPAPATTWAGFNSRSPDCLVGAGSAPALLRTRLDTTASRTRAMAGDGGPHRRPARSSGGPMVGRRHRGPAGVGVRPESDHDPRFSGGCGFSTARESAPQPLGEESFSAVATHLGGRNGSSPSGFSRAVALRIRGSTDCHPQRLRPRSEVSTTA